MKTLSYWKFLMISALSLLIAATAFGAERDRVFQAQEGIAINGYDPVAYFEENGPKKGSSEFTVEWDGATWLFASSENRDKFESDPEKWAPAYGGYCAWAVSKNYLASTDPDAWSIVDDRLYLNFNKQIRSRWSKNPARNIRRADKNWPGVLSK